jgi:acetyl-CoA synthetase/medium-chain acyl-CoA synthetase
VKAALVGGSWDIPTRFNFPRDVVEATAAENPSRRALVFVDDNGVVRRFTFAELAVSSAHWANLLRDVGVEPGDRIMVVVGKKPEWHGLLLGALRLGAITVPCPDLLRAKDLAFRTRDSGARVLIADRTAEAEVEAMVIGLDYPPLVIYLDEALAHLHEYEPRALFADTHFDEPAFILYTSGTTKDPKGVVHTHGYTFAKRMQAEHWLDARPGDLVWCTAGTGWAKSIWNVLLGPWSCGAEIVLHDAPFDPRERFDLVDRLGVTVLCQAPTEYRLMAKLDDLHQHDLSRLRHAVAAGEPLNPEVIKIFRDTFGVTIYDGYGQTENTLLVANGVGAHVRPGSMGLPTPGHEVEVIDDDGNAASPGVEGDIALKGHPPTLFAGYWHQPEETAAAFRGEWYVTGDRAVRDDEGYFWFTGRADDVILSAAYRIGPFEVESALLEHPTVAESAVVGKPDADRGQIVKAFVVLTPGVEPSNELASALQEHCREVTAPYKYPREVEFVDELPKTRSGKIRRVELRQLEEQRAGIAPPTPVAIVEPKPDTDLEEEALVAEAARAETKRIAEEEAERANAVEQERRAEEDRLRAEAEAREAEHARLRAEFEARRHAEEEQRRAEEEARLRAEEHQRRAEEEARQRAEEEARQRSEEEARRRAEEEQLRIDAERRRADEEQQRFADEARLHAEEEQRRAEADARLRADEDQRRAEQARLQAEEERVRADEARRRSDSEGRRQGEEVRRRAQEEAQRRAEEAWKALEEARRRAEHEAAARSAAAAADERNGGSDPEEKPRPTQAVEPEPEVAPGSFASRLLAYTRSDKSANEAPDRPADKDETTRDDARS